MRMFIYTLISLAALLAASSLLTGCNDEADPSYNLPDEVLVCDPPRPCSGPSFGGGGGDSFTSEDFSGQGGDGGSGGGAVLSIEGLEAADGNLGLMVVLKDCMPETTCQSTFTAQNQSGFEREFELRFAPNLDYQDTLELMTNCNRTLGPSDQCNSTVSFSGFPMGFERECIGELSYYASGSRVFRLPACAESVAGACRANPCLF